MNTQPSDQGIKIKLAENALENEQGENKKEPMSGNAYAHVAYSYSFAP